MNKVIEQLMTKFPKKTEFTAKMIKEAAIAVVRILDQLT